LVWVAPPHAVASVSPWSVTSPTPDSGQGDNLLRGVACASATSCQAVGNYINSANVSQTLAVAWSGTTWSVTPSPNAGTNNNYLFAVSCVLAVSCEAVGSYFNTGLIDRALIESWNGTKWSVVPSPDVGTKDNSLSGVSCVTAISCMAVGSYQTAPGVFRALVESWNGTKWSIVPSPNNGTNSNDLNAVSCVSATSCQAVGEYQNSSLGTTRTLVESWNGAKWSVAPSPNTGTGNNALTGVSCSTASSCVAVGSYFTSTAARTLIEAWNGTAWVVVASPNIGTSINALTGVSCFSTTSCEAVGYYNNTSSSVEQTLIESRA
jgi:hypothetical protein